MYYHNDIIPRSVPARVYYFAQARTILHTILHKHRREHTHTLPRAHARTHSHPRACARGVPLLGRRPKGAVGALVLMLHNNTYTIIYVYTIVYNKNIYIYFVVHDFIHVHIFCCTRLYTCIYSCTTNPPMHVLHRICYRPKVGAGEPARLKVEARNNNNSK